MIFGHTDATIPIEIANQYYLNNNKGVKGKPQIYTIGYDNLDACTFKPSLAETCIASAYWNWGPLLTELLAQMQIGTWEPTESPWRQMGGNSETSTAYLSTISGRPKRVYWRSIARISELARQDLPRITRYIGKIGKNWGCVKAV